MTDKPTRHLRHNKPTPEGERTSAQLRKAPNQHRAALTIQILFEAAAQIMESEGLAGLTTNRIAEQAGYAVGTVYQYFNNKESLLLAMAMHELEDVAQTTREAMEQAAVRSLDETLRATIHAWINAFGGRQRVQFLLMQAVMDHGAFPEFHRRITEIADFLGQKLAVLPVDGVRSLTPAGQFVITRALLGAIRYGVVENTSLLHQTSLETELIHLMRGMLLNPAEASGH